MDALERAVERLGDGAREHGLADAGNVLQQDVPPPQEGGEDMFDLLAVADDDPLDVLDDLGGRFAGGLDVFGGALLATRESCVRI